MAENRLLIFFLVTLCVPAVLFGYVALADRVSSYLPGTQARRVTPWLWAGPAFVFLAVFLVYPTLNTVYLSFLDATSSRFVGLDNYRHVFTSRGVLSALRNNALWLLLLTGFTVSFGILFAVLFDRVRFEGFAKAMVFLPMAISFVAAGVIWKLMYDYQPLGQPQTGTLNALVTAFGGEPVAWLVNRATNNAALIAVGVWVWTGFAVVILSAALKGISRDILDAARIDGANEWQLFRLVTVPLIGSTIAVVATTMLIFALKAFDIVYVMTNGNFGTDVLANRMYKEMFNFNHFGRASAIAVVLLLAIVPIMLYNVRRFREQEGMR